MELEKVSEHAGSCVLVSFAIISLIKLQMAVAAAYWATCLGWLPGTRS